jgi:hypothetical protein
VTGEKRPHAGCDLLIIGAYDQPTHPAIRLPKEMSREQFDIFLLEQQDSQVLDAIEIVEGQVTSKCEIDGALRFAALDAFDGLEFGGQPGYGLPDAVHQPFEPGWLGGLAHDEGQGVLDDRVRGHEDGAPVAKAPLELVEDASLPVQQDEAEPPARRAVLLGQP